MSEINRFDIVHHIKRNMNKIQLISIYRERLGFCEYDYIQIETDLAIGSGENISSLHIISLLDKEEGELLFEKYRQPIWRYGLNLVLSFELSSIVSQIYGDKFYYDLNISSKCVYRYYKRHLKPIMSLIEKFMLFKYVRLNTFNCYIFSSVFLNGKRVIKHE